MIELTREAFRKELDSLSRRLQTLTERFREPGKFSEEHQALLDRMQRDKDRLATRLSDAERMGTDWDLIKAEFAGDWNSLLANVVLLEEQLDARIASK